MWFKVDDDFDFHPKAITAGNNALGLWVRAGAYCGRMLTNGFVPKDMLTPLGGKPKDAQALVNSGLWEEAEGGWQFHDWLSRQPSRETVEQKRKDDAERKAEWRRRKDEQRRKSA